MVEINLLCKKINKYFYENDFFKHSDIRTFAYPQTITGIFSNEPETVIKLDFFNLKIYREEISFLEFEKLVKFMEELLNEKFYEYVKIPIRFLCSVEKRNAANIIEQKGLYIPRTSSSAAFFTGYLDLLIQIDRHIIVKHTTKRKFYTWLL